MQCEESKDMQLTVVIANITVSWGNNAKLGECLCKAKAEIGHLARV